MLKSFIYSNFLVFFIIVQLSDSSIEKKRYI